MAEDEKEDDKSDLFTKEERAYFDTRGESDIPQAPPPQEAPTAEPVAAEKSPPSTEPEPEQQVPFGVLREERKRRQESDERLRQAELLNARMEERFRAFRDAVTPQQRPAGPPPVDQDIFGAVKHLQQENFRTRAEIENYKRQIQQEDQLKQLRQWGADNEASFVRANTDYYQALNHLRTARAKELQVWGMSPSAIGDQLKHEENQLLARAAAERRNPAEMAYSLAQQRGYQKGPVAPATAPTKHEVDLNAIDRIAAGQKQSGTLSGAGGGTGRDLGDLEIEDLLKMSDKEFGAFIEKHPGRFRRLKGAAH